MIFIIATIMFPGCSDNKKEAVKIALEYCHMLNEELDESRIYY